MGNRNYTNYSKQNNQKKEEQIGGKVQSEENVQNFQENIENIEPATNAAPEPQTAQPEPEAPKAVIGVVVNCEKLNVRSAPSLNAKINLTLSKGEGVVILELVKGPDGEDFYKVGNPEHPEYCMAKYIKIN